MICPATTAAPRDRQPVPARQRIVAARAERTASVLVHEEGLRRGDRVVILCCDEDVVSRSVAVHACRTTGIDGLLVGVAHWDLDLARLIRWSGAALTLACQHGSQAWEANRCVGRVLGEGPLLPWWRGAEANADLTRPVSADPLARGSISVVRRDGESWRSQRLRPTAAEGP